MYGRGRWMTATFARLYFRLASSNMYFVKNARNYFQMQGSKRLNDLKSSELYNNSVNKPMFLKALKKTVIDQY